MSAKPAARSIKKSSPLKDGPRTKTNKGAGPLDHLFSPAPEKAKKAAAKIEETVSLAEAAPTKNKAGRFHGILFLWGTVSSIPPSWHTKDAPLVARPLYRHNAATF